MFEEEKTFIWRLKVPFENVTTSVFLLQTGQGWVLFDCASNADDVTTFILPALDQMAVPHEGIRWLFCSHSHSDHAGGMDCVLQSLPNIKLAEQDQLPDCLRVLDLPGHTQDCRAILDLRTRTLLSGDCLQFCGIDRFGCGLHSAVAYRRSIGTIREWKPECILASHDYVPFGARADSAEEATAWLDFCENYLDEAVQHTRQCVGEGIKDARSIAERFWDKHPSLPPLHEVTIQSILCEEMRKE